MDINEQTSYNLVIACYMQRNWVLHEVELAFDEVDPLFFSTLEN